MNNVFLKISLKILSPLILVSSVYVLLKGHNEPGGGFIGGLLAALSWTLVKIGSQNEEAPDSSKENFIVMAIGLAFALFSGVYAIFFDSPLYCFLGAGCLCPNDRASKIINCILF
jgi:multicomponent Na+:H+ antiporter subunit B